MTTGIGTRPETVLNALVSAALSLGVFDRVNTHEPKAAPGNGVVASYYLADLRPNPLRSGLNVTSARLVFNCRIGTNFLAEPADGIDLAILRATTALIGALHNNLDVDDPGSELDILGMAGITLSAEAGYINQDNKIFRVIDVTIPILMDDVWVQVN